MGQPETLKRSWCVYEVYLSVTLNARFEVALGKSQKAAFLQDIQEWDSLYRLLYQVNCKNSITTVPSDRDRIFQLIEASVGFVQLDQMVFGVLQKWIMQALETQSDFAATSADRFQWMVTKVRRFWQIILILKPRRPMKVP